MTATALKHLRQASDDLLAAYADLVHAKPRLYGARQTRAAEIMTHLDIVINDLDRLLIITAGDLRADQ
jgi:hypothetical protein